MITQANKKNFFQKAGDVGSFLGQIEDAESENALSFAELALVFEIFYFLYFYIFAWA